MRGIMKKAVVMGVALLCSAAGLWAQPCIPQAQETAQPAAAGDTLMVQTVQATDASGAPEAPADDNSRVAQKRKAAVEKPRFMPDPEKATWLGVVFPGAGQMYNRKYWKLPIVYGGFIGCLYAYNWNSQMYSDYRQAYLDIMDADPNTDSFKDFFRPGYDFDKNSDYLKNVFKKRKDRYRRWRDLSVFAFIGVYALSVIDAYVDAQLANFDIGDDINVTLTPTSLNTPVGNSFADGYYGLNLNINF